jgi:hypothetical protein
MHFIEPSVKINDYIKEVEICHDERDIEMSNSEEAKNSNFSPIKQISSQENEFETPQRKKRAYQENKSENGHPEYQEAHSDYKLISDSKTAPLMMKRDDMMVDDEFTEARKYFTSKKTIQKSVKLAHLNSLSAMIGEVGNDKVRNIAELYPEIVFHSPYCPYPAHLPKRHQIESNLSPCFRQSLESEQHEPINSDQSMCQNSHCKHEKALCRVFDTNGHPIPFDQK